MRNAVWKYVGTAVVAFVAVAAAGYWLGTSGGSDRGVPESVPADALRAEIEAIVDERLAAVTRDEPAPNQPGPSAPAQTVLGADLRSELEALIRPYLLANPEVIADAITELQVRQQEAELALQAGAITQNADQIFNSDRQVVIGNPDGDVTLVEFFDYNCSFCRRAMDDVERLLENDPDLRIVLKEFPVLGEGSTEAARISIAVSLAYPERFEEFHFALMSERAQADGPVALAIAQELGMSVEALTPFLDTGEADATINEVFEIAGYLSLTGTPTFVTANEVVVGAVGYDALASRIASLRAN